MYSAMNAHRITKNYEKYNKIFANEIFANIFIFIQCNESRPATLANNKFVDYETEMFHQMS